MYSALIAISVFINSFPKKVLTKNFKLKIGSAVSTGNHTKYMHVIFPWPPVIAAHERNRTPRL
jgi:hypothetical protein